MGFSPLFTTQIEARNGVASIALCGELDMATVPILEHHLAQFESDGVAEIVLDLRGLTFMDSTAVHAFLDARDRAKTSGRRLTLIEPSPHARRVFELTGTRSLLSELGAVEVPEQAGAGSDSGSDR
jgi:anti-sigma B factor antagonist